MEMGGCASKGIAVPHNKRSGGMRCGAARLGCRSEICRPHHSSMLKSDTLVICCMLAWTGALLCTATCRPTLRSNLLSSRRPSTLATSPPFARTLPQTRTRSCSCEYESTIYVPWLGGLIAAALDKSRRPCSFDPGWLLGGPANSRGSWPYAASTNTVTQATLTLSSFTSPPVPFHHSPRPDSMATSSLLAGGLLSAMTPESALSDAQPVGAHVVFAI